MKIIALNKKQHIYQGKNIVKHYSQFERLIIDLKEREIPAGIIQTINHEINLINSYTGKEKDFLRLVKNAQKDTLKLLEEELKLVPKLYYRNYWTVIGMVAGLLFSLTLSLLGFDDTWNSFGLLIPLGLVFGSFAGNNKDEETKKNGLQLKF